MMKYTAFTDALTVVDLASFPQLDDRAREWVHTLGLRGQNIKYPLHPDFADGYQAGYKARTEYDSDEFPTVEQVIREIEYSLSRKILARYSPDYSYAWMVGSIFGYLTALLQTDTTQTFDFLLAPVSAMHVCLSRLTGSSGAQ